MKISQLVNKIFLLKNTLKLNFESGLISKTSKKAMTSSEEYSFYNNANLYLEVLFNRLDEEDQIPCENIEFSMGVLSFSLGNRKYVLNLQRPNRQIWLSSPISGPQRYEFNNEIKKWVNVRDVSIVLDKVIEKEINEYLIEKKIEMRFELM